MPTIITRGAASARGFGFGGTANVPYWIAAYYSNTGSVNYGPIIINNSNQILSLGQASGTNNGVFVLTSAGALNTQLTQSLYSDIPQYYYKTAFFDSVNNFFHCVGTTNSTGQFAVSKISAASYAFSWTAYFSLSSNAYNASARAVAADSSGNVYAVGQLAQNAPCCVLYGYGSIAKFTSNGTFSWCKLRSRNLSTTDIFNGVVVNSGNAPVAAGSYLDDTGNSVGVIMSFDSAGNEVWSRKFYTGTNNVFFQGVVKDSSDNYYICGYDNTVNRAIIVKYNSSGVIQWQRTVSTVNAYSIAIDSLNNIYVYAYGSSVLYILKYNSSGVIQWQRSFTYNSPLAPLSGIAAIEVLNSDRSVILSAGINSSSLGSGINRVIYKYPSDGSKQGTYAIGSRSVVVSASSLTDAAGSYTDAAAGMTNRTGITLTSGTLTSPTYSAASNSLSVSTI